MSGPPPCTGVPEDLNRATALFVKACAGREQEACDRLVWGR